jgi:hypothetical protein
MGVALFVCLTPENFAADSRTRTGAEEMMNEAW